MEVGQPRWDDGSQSPATGRLPKQGARGLGRRVPSIASLYKTGGATLSELLFMGRARPHYMGKF